MAGNDELRAFCTSTLVEGINADNALPILVRKAETFLLVTHVKAPHREP